MIVRYAPASVWLVLAAAATLFAAIPVRGWSSACRNSISGEDFDLNQLTSLSDYVWEDLASAYRVNFCQTVQAGTTACIPKAAGMCSYSKSDNTDTALASWSEGAAPVWSYLSSDSITAGIRLTFAQSEQCANGLFRKTTLNMPCTPGSLGGVSQVVANLLGCTWTIYFPTSAACLGAAPPEPDPDPNTGGDNNGLPISIGTLFCIIVLVTAFSYVAVGCWYKRKRMGTEGCFESCPNVDFWRELPGLVYDGCRFSMRKLCYCYRPDAPVYEDL